MSKIDQNFDRKKGARAANLGPARRNALASGGIIGGSKNLHFEDLLMSKAYYDFKIWRFVIWIGHLAIYPTRRLLLRSAAGGGFKRSTHSASPGLDD